MTCLLLVAAAVVAVMVPAGVVSSAEWNV